MSAMSLHKALKIVAANRGEHLVVTTMASVGEWPKISDSPRDFHYLPSSMGQGVPLGLGLAMAKPGLGVIVLMGDGGLLMNLGSLVTLAQHALPVYVVLIDNGLYEVTGGQPVAGAGKTDFALLARGAGIERVYNCQCVQEWQNRAGEALSGMGPVLVWLKVAGERGKATPSAPRPMSEQIQRLRAAIA